MAPLSFFDLDHTLIRANAAFEFGRFLYRKSLLSGWLALTLCIFYGFYLCRIISMNKLHKTCFKLLFSGCHSMKVEEWAQQFVAECFSPLINKNVYTLLRTLQQEKKTVFILSSSPEFLVQAIGKSIGLQEHDCYGTSYKKDSQNRLLGVERVLDGSSKAEIVKAIAKIKGVSLEDIAAYSDSIVDLPMLALVGNPVAVNPCRRLQHQAHLRSWTIFN